MSWNLLARLDIVCRPLTDWPGARTPDAERTTSRFDAGLTATVETLARELRHLDAQRIVLQVDLKPSQIRNDGLPRSDARAASPGVVLGFDSTHGPLRYACDRFVKSPWRREGGEDWTHNLRAIALGLEHLRAVDRYGITKRGEQYRGWAELPAGIAAPATHMTSDEAAQLLLDAAHRDPASAGIDPKLAREHVRTRAGVREKVYRDAVKISHPDAGGSAELFQRLQAAKQLLEREASRG